MDESPTGQSKQLPRGHKVPKVLRILEQQILHVKLITCKFVWFTQAHTEMVRHSFCIYTYGILLTITCALCIFTYMFLSSCLLSKSKYSILKCVIGNIVHFLKLSCLQSKVSIEPFFLKGIIQPWTTVGNCWNLGTWRHCFNKVWQGRKL